jgi:MFS family permease
MKYFTNALLVRNHNYRYLFIGQFVSFIGTMITSVVLPYQIYQETHSTLMVGLLGLFQLMPLVFTALIGGVFADRHHRRLLLLITEALLALGCALLLANAYLQTPRIWVIFIVASAMSAITGFHRPALGGLLIAFYGIHITFMIDIGSFVVSLVALLLMTQIPAPQAKKDNSTWMALKEGYHYAVSRQELMGSYLVDFCAMIFGMPSALFPAIADAHGGAKMVGLLYSAPAVGALLLSFRAGWVTKVSRHGVAISVSAILWGVAIILFGLVANFWVGLFFLTVAGGFDAISGIFRSIMWNETIPNNFRGRLSGIEMISYLSGPRLGDTEAGLVAAAFGVSASVVSGGVLCIASVGLSAYFLPRFWAYRSKLSVH